MTTYAAILAMHSHLAYFVTCVHHFGSAPFAMFCQALGITSTSIY